MSNFERNIKNQGRIAKLEAHIETMEQVEVRQLLVLACYEAMAGGINSELLRRTNDMLMNAKFKTRQEMYASALSCAKTVQTEIEFEEAEKAFKQTQALELQASEPDRIQDSEPAAETSRQLYEPGKLGK